MNRTTKTLIATFTIFLIVSLAGERETRMNTVIDQLSAQYRASSDDAGSYQPQKIASRKKTATKF
ncbi:MAG: hypothetical protein DRI97_01595 [Bacteroidetes bacterium]|nr:MAG: hypothetical protein DRI83_00895 [Bacteroidota bacterium]RLD59179.1 MAG: hypothetical protein DRI97_01595 [Bacteroidota bacterium]RLD80157.1 MAG: hypothetical protein DRJ15_07710 [Bacteroidota bacterium]